MGCLELMPEVHLDQTVYWSDGGSMGTTMPRKPTFYVK